MTWEYDNTLPSDKDKVRFIIQDTNDSEHLLEDEELEWLLVEQGNVYLAGAAACEVLAGRFRAKVTSKSVGGLSISYANRADEFAKQATLLRTQSGNLATSIPTPVWTAQTISEKEERDTDEDRNATPFALGMHDNEGTAAYGG